LGTSVPERIWNAVDLPMPLGPSRPMTVPLRGMGRRNSLKPFTPNWWTSSESSASGRLTMEMASHGHLCTQMPHPMHMISEMTAFSVRSSWTMHSAPCLLMGQK
jgi:hypothetical protein